MLTVFDSLNAHLQKSKKPQAYNKWFLTNQGMLVNWKGPEFRTQSSKMYSKPCNIFPQNFAHGYFH